MKYRRNLLLAGASGIVVSAGLIAPALGQQRGGFTSTFSIQNGAEVTRNPTLTPGNDDVRTVLNTDLSYAVRTQTRGTQLELAAGARLRYAFGDVAASDEGFDIGRETVSLTYANQAPRARFDAFVQYFREDLSFLDATDLIELDDGNISVTEDFTDITGTGTRESITYRLSAQFDEDGPFGWGVTISGRDLNYSDVSSAGLVDSTTFNTAVNAHFDITPTLRIDSRVRYLKRETDAIDTTSTTSLSLGATAVRSDDFSVRGLLTFAAPDNNDNRLSVTGGFTARPSDRSRISVDVGASFSDDFDTRLIGRLSYDLQPTTKSRFNIQLNTDVTDSIDDEVVVNTVALLGADFELTPVSSLSFDAVFANEDALVLGEDQTEFSASVQLNRQLTKDWQMSVGVSHTSRRETGISSANSEAIFVNFGRSWNGKF